MLTASIVGCGRGGGLSLSALQASTCYTLLAAADVAAASRERVRQRCPEVSLYTDFEEMLAANPTDVVCVATPAPTHVPIARKVLAQGVRGLLLEKPLACNATAAERLLGDIRAAGLPVVVPHGLLVLPAPQEIRQRIRRGDIGKLLRVDVQNKVDLMNAGIHWLVYLLDMLGDDCPETVEADFDVSGRAINDGVRIESRGTTRIETQSGVRITLHSGHRTMPSSTVLPEAEQQGALFRMTGSDGIIEFSAWAGSYWIETRRSGAELIRRTTASDPGYHQIFLERLAGNIAAGETDYTSAELSLAALRLIDAAYRSHAGGDWRLGEPVHAE